MSSADAANPAHELRRRRAPVDYNTKNFGTTPAWMKGEAPAAAVEAGKENGAAAKAAKAKAKAKAGLKKGGGGAAPPSPLRKGGGPKMGGGGGGGAGRVRGVVTGERGAHASGGRGGPASTSGAGSAGGARTATTASTKRGGGGHVVSLVATSGGGPAPTSYSGGGPASKRARAGAGVGAAPPPPPYAAAYGAYLGGGGGGAGLDSPGLPVRGAAAARAAAVAAAAVGNAAGAGDMAARELLRQVQVSQKRERGARAHSLGPRLSHAGWSPGLLYPACARERGRWRAVCGGAGGSLRIGEPHSKSPNNTQDEFAILQDKYRRVKEQRIGEVEALLADHDRRVSASGGDRERGREEEEKLAWRAIPGRAHHNESARRLTHPPHPLSLPLFRPKNRSPPPAAWPSTGRRRRSARPPWPTWAAPPRRQPPRTPRARRPRPRARPR